MPYQGNSIHTIQKYNISTIAAEQRFYCPKQPGTINGSDTLFSPVLNFRHIFLAGCLLYIILFAFSMYHHHRYSVNG